MGIEYPEVEIPSYNLKVHNKECTGCVRHGKDIMITWCIPGEDDQKVAFVDSFLTDSQAINLIAQLALRLNDNKLLKNGQIPR